MANRLFLTGFSGTGKSSVGQMLAALRGVSFIDLDSQIEQSENMPIAEIFKLYGEGEFRRLEEKYLQQTNAEIVACGGGITTVRENIEWMKAHGKIILLAATPTEIAKRLANDYSRPLLEEASIKKLLFARAYAYIQADIIVDTTNLSVVEVAECLL